MKMTNQAALTTLLTETPSAFHPRAQRTAFRRRDVRQQSRLFAPENQRPKRNRSSNRVS